MLDLILSLFGFCRHRRISWPLTRERVTTVSCLVCGKRMAYDWQEMREIR